MFSMFYKWTELNFKRRGICAVLICYESMTIFCAVYLKAQLFAVTSCHKRFPRVRQLLCLLVAAGGSSGYLYRCIISSPSLQSNSITLTAQGEADSRQEDIHR